MTLRASSHTFWSADGGPSDRGAGSGCGSQSGCLEADCGSCNCVPDSDIRREPRQCHGERSWTKSQLHKSSFGFGAFIWVFVCLRWKPSRRRAMYGAITGVSRHWRKRRWWTILTEPLNTISPHPNTSLTVWVDSTEITLRSVAYLKYKSIDQVSIFIFMSVSVMGSVSTILASWMRFCACPCVCVKQIDWMDTDRQLRETAAEIQESAQCEAQRKALKNSELSLLLPAHVLHALTGGQSSRSYSHWEHIMWGMDQCWLVCKHVLLHVSYCLIFANI